MNVIEKIKDRIGKVEREEFRDSLGHMVGCSPVDKKNLAGVCSDGKKTILVNNFRNPSEVKEKFGLTPPIREKAYRDYSQAIKITKTGFAVGTAIASTFVGIPPFFQKTNWIIDLL
jgi:hypothetical protein